MTTSNTERKEYAEGGAADGQGTSREFTVILILGGTHILKTDLGAVFYSHQGFARFSRIANKKLSS